MRDEPRPSAIPLNLHGMPHMVPSPPSGPSSGPSVGRYKTQMCRHEERQVGGCRRGDNCNFAHTQSELSYYQHKHANGPYWEPLHREPLHWEPPQVMCTDKIKTQLCRHDQKGYCRLGDQCCFAHGQHELRQ
ncbi:MAG: hypothetical protein MHM6MM_002379 [Cercozoa sp. M6MM]